MKITEYSLLTPAVSPALNLDEVKAHLKISGTDYDSQLLGLIEVVTQYAEKATGRDLINKTYKGYADSFSLLLDSLIKTGYYPTNCQDGIQIRKSKLQSITSIQYYLDGVLTTLSSADYYFTDSTDYSSIYLVEGKTWPTADNRKQAVIITFVAGYGDDDCNIPKLLKQAMLSQLTLLFENAGDCAEETEQFKQLYTPWIIASNFVRVV